MRRYVLRTLSICLGLATPLIVLAHQSGCHRWHTCPSDTGSYEMEYNNDGSVKPYCGSSMYLGSDGKCHYTTTPSSSLTTAPASTVKSSVKQPPKYSQTTEGLDPVCGDNAYYTLQSGCTCRKGYAKKAGACEFKGCPAGYTKDDKGECKASIQVLSMRGRKICLSKKPCKCEAGYQPLANKWCIPLDPAAK